jgi:hypothetical protein
MKDIVIRNGGVQFRVKSTPEALFQAAGVLALAGLVLSLVRRS